MTVRIMTICAVLTIGLNAMGGEQVKNVLANVPYAAGQMGKRQLVDEKRLLIKTPNPSEMGP